MSTFTIISIIVSGILTAFGFVGFAYTKRKLKAEEETKKLKKNSIVFLVITLISLWYLIGTIISNVFIFGNGGGGLHLEFDMMSPRKNIFGISFAETTIFTWIIIAIVLVFSLIFRFFVFPKFEKDNPRGFQNVIETIIEAMDNFIKKSVNDYSDVLAPYMFSLVIYMIMCAAAELFGFRAPTSDIVVTFAMGIITFGLINFYGIKKKGVKGRLQSLAKPNPIILPMKILSDITVPVSMACRLFGNMLGGMIVMDLLKTSLGGYASGIPAIAGLYFNLFHPLMQAYIFIILTLTFINEAIE